MTVKRKSRSTLWREGKRQKTLCDCPYHQAAVEETSDSCDCQFHLEARSPSPCNCEYHCDIPEKSVHSSSNNYASPITSDTNEFSDENDIHSDESLLEKNEMQNLDFQGSSPTSVTCDSLGTEWNVSPNMDGSLKHVHGKDRHSDDSLFGKDAMQNLNLQGSSPTSVTSDSCGTKWNVSPNSDGFKGVKDNNSDSDDLFSTGFKVVACSEQRVPMEMSGGNSSDDGECNGPNASSDSEDSGNPEDQENDQDLEDPPDPPDLGDSDGPGDSDDPDNPDDPDDPEYSDNEESDSDPDNDMAPGQRNFSLDDESLNEVLEMVEGCTAREVVAMVIALSVRSNLDYQTTVKIFTIINVLLRNSPLPITKEQMWRTLSRTYAGIRKHVYCSLCFRLLGLLSQLPNPVVCQCGWTSQRSKAKYFITLNVRSQIEAVLNKPDIWEKLQYPQLRQKSAPDAIEDIFDGEAYKQLWEMDGGPSSPFDFTYTFNLDGFKVSKSSKTEAMPIFMRINELPPNLRQKNVLLAGLWLDKDTVSFNLFMQVFVKQANRLSTNGVSWRPNGVDLQISRFFPTACCVDAKGRAGVLNMALYAGEFGCTFCEHRGIKLEGSMKFPIAGTVVQRQRVHQGAEYIEEVVIQDAPVRTDAMIRHLMEQAGVPGGRRIRGVIGPSQLMLMNFFDLGRGFSTDDLHPIFKGVTEFHTELLLQGIPGVYQVGRNERAIISHRLVNSVTPTHISRKPRGIESMYMWKGTEWRNWLFYYGVPCMQGIVPNVYLRVFGLLSKAVYLLSRDIILQANWREGRRSLLVYVRRFQEIYGPQNMRFNVHMLTHCADCVWYWGPLWAHSTFPYESWNHRLGKTLSSPRGAIDQVVMRYIMGFLVDSIPDHPLISDEVKELISTRIFESKLKNVQIVDGAYFFGRSVRRVPTEAETAMLADEGYNHNHLVEYFQVKIRGLECRSINYRGEGQSNNTFIYTTEDDFGVVESIVMLEGENLVGGMFVRLYAVGNGILGVPHIVPIVNQNEMSFIPITNIRNLCVKVRVGEQWYIAPMPNQMEID